MRSLIACSTVMLSLAAAFPAQGLADARVVETGIRYPSIGAAVSAAPSGAIIEVSSGIYREALVLVMRAIWRDDPCLVYSFSLSAS